MRRLSASALILASIATAMPAPAQIVGRDRSHAPTPSPFFDDGRIPGPGVHRELRDVRNRIERARERGEISRREARQLRREARRIGALATRYGSDGMSAAEQSLLASHTQVLRDAASRPRPARRD